MNAAMSTADIGAKWRGLRDMQQSKSVADMKEATESAGGSRVSPSRFISSAERQWGYDSDADSVGYERFSDL
jgi:hypothetical protein